MRSSALDPAEAELIKEHTNESRKRKRISDGAPNTAPSQAAIESETTRCAQATLQFDVDLLTLEYLLHQAIGAQFRALRPKDNGPDAADASLAQFRGFHPDYEFEAGTAFNMILLETIVLLRAMGSESAAASTSSSSTRDYNGLIETRDMLRRRMLTTNSDQSDNSVLCPPLYQGVEGAVKTLRNFLFYGWTREGLQDRPEPSNNTFDTYRLLGRFMVVSSRIAQQLGTSGINQYWMRLAGELMLHAALEALETSDFIRSHGDVGPEKPVAPIQPGLLDCFAFRYLPPEKYDTNFLQYRRSPCDDALSSENRVSARFSTSMKDEEQAISEMFAEDSELWNEQRYRYLSEFAIPAQLLDEAADEGTKGTRERLSAYYQHRVAELRLIHPFAETKASLVLCLESLWDMNTSPDISGKPVLVQIEEGGLEGFTDEQFQAFLARVGLEELTTFERVRKQTSS